MTYSKWLAFEEVVHKQLNIPISVARSLITGEDKKLPFLGQGLHINMGTPNDTKTWSITVDEMKIFVRRVEQLLRHPKYVDLINSIRSIATSTYKEKSLSDIVIKRNALAENDRIYLPHTYLAFVEKRGSIREERRIRSTAMLKHIHDYKEVTWLCGYAWIFVYDEFDRVIKPGNIITFNARSYIYKDQEGSLKAGLRNITDIHVLSKNEIEAFRKLKKEKKQTTYK